MIVWILIVSCSSEYVSEDSVEILTPYRSVERTFDFLEDFDFTAGVILSIAKIGENDFLFLDFAQRSLFHLDMTENQIRQVGQHGDGPGEYRNPIYFQSNWPESIAFTDISNMSVKFIQLDGTFVHQVEHRLGGGKQFILYEEEIYVLGGLTDPQQDYHQLTVLDMNGNVIREMFPVREEYENQVRTYGMGDITLIGDQIFFMNSVEPVIYIYNIKTSETSEIRSFNVENNIFSSNDGFSLMHLNSNELRTIYDDGDVTIFQRIDQIIINDEIYVAISARKGKDLFTYFLDKNDLTIQYYYTPSHNIIGVQGHYIYESDIYSKFGVVEEVKFSINNDGNNKQ